MRLISLDVETAGLIPGKHHVLSIGAVDLKTKEDFYVQLLWDEILVCPKAMQVNQIDLCNKETREPKWEMALSPRDAMVYFYHWLCNLDCNLYETRALGQNVGSFDLPMLKATWALVYPETEPPFSYRSVDLNTVVSFGCEKGAFGDGAQPSDVKKGIEDEGWDQFRQTYLYTQMKKHYGSNPFFLKHHALCDAWWNVHVWDYLKKVV